VLPCCALEGVKGFAIVNGGLQCSVTYSMRHMTASCRPYAATFRMLSRKMSAGTCSNSTRLLLNSVRAIFLFLFGTSERSFTLKANNSKSPMAMLQVFNPLEFWHELRSELPLLHLVACRHLAAPCAESLAESMFSSGGALDGKCSVVTVECRIQMRINSRLLEKNIGLIRKVPVYGSIQCFLNLDYANKSAETEEFADYSSNEEADITTEES